MENAIIWWVINHSLNKVFRYISQLASCAHHRISLPLQACNCCLSWNKAFQAVLQAPKTLCEARQYGTCTKDRLQRAVPNSACTEGLSRAWINTCCFSTSNYNLDALAYWDVYPSHASPRRYLSALSVAARVQQTCRLRSACKSRTSLRQDTRTELRQRASGSRGWICHSRVKEQGPVYVGKKYQRVDQGFRFL